MAITPPKTNMPPKNQWLEDVFPMSSTFLGGMFVFRGVFFGYLWLI